MRPVIYIAGNYTGADIDERNVNIEIADEAGRQCFLKGFMPVVPHSITAGWEFDDRFPEDTDWVEADFALLQHCQALCVCNERWEQSQGTLREIAFAKANGLPVYFGVESVPTAEDFTVDIPSQVCTDLVNRRQFGVTQYGRPLYPFNGRDTLKDAYEEAIDLVQYLRTLVAEREALESMRLVRIDEPEDSNPQ